MGTLKGRAWIKLTKRQEEEGRNKEGRGQPRKNGQTEQAGLPVLSCTKGFIQQKVRKGLPVQEGQQEGLSGENCGADSLNSDESSFPERDSEAVTPVINGIRMKSRGVICNHFNSRK